MKEENQPIKVECIAAKSKNSRESIGFVLIPMLQIPFWNFRKSGMMKSHWHKLLGVADQFKPRKPELLLNVTITEKGSVSDDVELNENADEADEEFPIRCVNGNIYLGSESDQREEFVVSIELKHAEQLESLGNFVSARSSDQFDVRYNFAWDKTVTCPKDEIAGVFAINEVVKFKVFSTWTNVIDYFRRFFLLNIEILNQTEVVGSCVLKVDDVMLSLPASKEEFEKVFDGERQRFCFDDYLKIDSSSNAADKPSVATLSYSFGMNCVKTEDFPALQIESACSRLSCTSVPLMSAEDVQSHRTGSGNSSGKVIPRTFAYNLSIIDCTFNRRPNAGVWQFSLQHENADNPLNIRNIEISDLNVDRICFEDLDLSLSFSTNADQLIALIQSRTSLLSLKGPKGVHAVAELDNTNLLAQEKNTGIVLLANDRGEQVSMAHISVEIVDLGFNFNSRDRSRPTLASAPSTAMLDENLAYKMIEELEEWKEFQQQEFIASLKRKEIGAITRLTNDWHRKRGQAEAELKQKISHCDMLTRTLEQAHKKISLLEKSDASHEKSVARLKNQLEREAEKKVTALQNRIRSLEDEVRQQKCTENVKLRSIQQKYEQICIEHEKLKLKAGQLERSLRDATENTVPKEEAAGLQANIVSISGFVGGRRLFEGFFFFHRQF